jgi:hypothetical protein
MVVEQRAGRRHLIFLGDMGRDDNLKTAKGVAPAFLIGT